ncbi:hypothetical protein GCM10011497_11520 [Elstera cyanobacteriorum]|nr:DMT family transporter [Elstera cyanobacteriorum]GFZ84319.1 hypothetical protein GCM10011497_11520 [Elstera cyanobacteriorum]
MLGEASALLASLSWTVGPLIATPAIKEIGSVAFSRSRMVVFVVLLGTASALFADWSRLTWDATFWAVLSGIIGLSLGDVALFQCYKMIGPRLGSLIYMSAAPFTIVLGWAFLGEALPLQALAGGALALGGIAIAVSRKEKEAASLAPEPGALVRGILFGLLGGLGQAGGSLLQKPALLAGVDPILVAFLRAVGSLGLFLLITKPTAFKQPLRLWKRIGLAGTVSASGVFFVSFAIAHTETGLAAILSALPPIMMLPVLRIFFGVRLSWVSWAATVLALAGVVLILTR